MLHVSKCFTIPVVYGKVKMSNSIADEMLDELEAAVTDFITNYGKHDGECTNVVQVRNLPKVDACSKHLKAMAEREARVKSALLQFKTLRNLFTVGLNNEERHF